MDNKLSRDYDVNQVPSDPRFLLCKKDMVVVQIVYLSFTVLLVLLSYLLCPQDAGEMTYLLGMPLWVAVTTLLSLGYIAFVVVWSLTRRRFTLAAKGGTEEVRD